jgi:hypothetical protein
VFVGVHVGVAVGVHVGVAVDVNVGKVFGASVGVDVKKTAPTGVGVFVGVKFPTPTGVGVLLGFGVNVGVGPRAPRAASFGTFSTEPCATPGGKPIVAMAAKRAPATKGLTSVFTVLN